MGISISIISTICLFVRQPISQYFIYILIFSSVTSTHKRKIHFDVSEILTKIRVKKLSFLLKQSQFFFKTSVCARISTKKYIKV